MNKHPIDRKSAVARKPITRPLGERTAAGAKRQSSSGKAKDQRRRVDDGARRAMISQAAYFRAEKRGFASGGELDDWLAAERQIARMLDA